MHALNTTWRMCHIVWWTWARHRKSSHRHLYITGVANTSCHLVFHAHYHLQRYDHSGIDNVFTAIKHSETDPLHGEAVNEVRVSSRDRHLHGQANTHRYRTSKRRLIETFCEQSFLPYWSLKITSPNTQLRALRTSDTHSIFQNFINVFHCLTQCTRLVQGWALIWVNFNPNRKLSQKCEVGTLSRMGALLQD